VVRKKRLNPLQCDWTLAFCDVTGATNERTCIAGVLPLDDDRLDAMATADLQDVVDDRYEVG
jgi:hypothetical protein